MVAAAGVWTSTPNRCPRRRTMARPACPRPSPGRARRRSPAGSSAGTSARRRTAWPGLPVAADGLHRVPVGGEGDRPPSGESVAWQPLGPAPGAGAAPGRPGRRPARGRRSPPGTCRPPPRSRCDVLQQVADRLRRPSCRPARVAARVWSDPGWTNAYAVWPGCPTGRSNTGVLFDRLMRRGWPFGSRVARSPWPGHVPAREHPAGRRRQRRRGSAGGPKSSGAVHAAGGAPAAPAMRARSWTCGGHGRNLLGIGSVIRRSAGAVSVPGGATRRGRRRFPRARRGPRGRTARPPRTAPRPGSARRGGGARRRRARGAGRGSRPRR